MMSQMLNAVKVQYHNISENQSSCSWLLPVLHNASQVLFVSMCGGIFHFASQVFLQSYKYAGLYFILLFPEILIETIS